MSAGSERGYSTTPVLSPATGSESASTSWLVVYCDGLLATAIRLPAGNTVAPTSPSAGSPGFAAAGSVVERCPTCRAARASHRSLTSFGEYPSMWNG
jgi:hypothetical protein